VRKKKLAVFTATGCQACENCILDVHFQVSSLTPHAEVAFWPYVMGNQWSDLDAEEQIDVCLVAGAVRTADDRQAVLKLREKSRVLVALGACAAFGGMTGLLNVSANGDDMAVVNSEEQGAIPPLPEAEQRVSALTDIVEVDYTVPGCPPPQNLVWSALQALLCSGETTSRISFAASRLPDPIAESITSGVLPPHGSTFAGDKAVCASCSRVKEEKKFQAAHRPYQIDPDPGRCLLEQGLLCQGVATREGCGGLCTAVGAPCRGCFGKAEAIFDPGAKMISAISSTFDSTDAAEIDQMSRGFVDLAGTLYRYTMPSQCVLLPGPAKEEEYAGDDL
jgi:F420-non-reducing hydrogenase small subunit